MPNEFERQTFEEVRDFFAFVEQENFSGALSCLDTREESEESDRKWFNDWLIASALRRNWDDSTPSSAWPIPQSLWKDFFRLISSKWEQQTWSRHLDKIKLLEGAILFDHCGAIDGLGEVFSPEEINQPGIWRNNTPLTYSIYVNSASSLVPSSLLGIRGIDPSQKDGFGRTPLAMAVYENKLAFLPLLLSHGTDPNVILNIKHTWRNFTL